MYIDILILLIPTPLVSVLFLQQYPNYCSFFIFFSSLFQCFIVIKFYVLNNFFPAISTHIRANSLEPFYIILIYLKADYVVSVLYIAALLWK